MGLSAEVWGLNPLCRPELCNLGQITRLLWDSIYFILFFRFIYLFVSLFILERGEGKEKEKDRNNNVWLLLTRLLLGTWPTTQT